MRPEVAQAVQAVYDAVGEHGSHAPRGLALATGRDLALTLGYSAEALATVPAALLDAFVGAGPVAALAAPQPGQLVVDLGCGAGVDSFLAALAGARVVSLDASVPMLRRLHRALPTALRPHLSPLRANAPHLPLAGGCAAHVWLNGVANLVPDRAALCAELGRVLRPGGQLTLADVFAREPVPPELRDLPEAWAWCVAGAAAPEAWQQDLQHAGFDQVTITVSEEIPPFCRGILRAVRSSS